jgi:hypothetical protein
MSAKKPQSKKRQAAASGAKARTKKQMAGRAKVQLGPGRVTVSYAHPNQILPTLLEVSGHFAAQHIASPEGIATDVLGTARAQIIVSGCANSTCWSCTLGDIGVSLDLFRTCVFNHVSDAGFTIALNQIPALTDTKLVDVVTAIQSAGLAGDPGVNDPGVDEASVEDDRVESDSLAGDSGVDDP